MDDPHERQRPAHDRARVGQAARQRVGRTGVARGDDAREQADGDDAGHDERRHPGTPEARSPSADRRDRLAAGLACLKGK